MQQKIGRKLTLLFIALIFVGVMVPRANATTINLNEWAFNVNGVIVPPNPLPGYAAVDDSFFDWVQGLGTITITMSSGSYFGAFFDHEIDQDVNTWFNEYGDTNGAPASGQSWEIDEPGWVFGDIYDNLIAGSLDNGNGVPAGSPDDVSMALAWNFILNPGDTAEISLILSDNIVPSGFYLSQTDPDSNQTIYFSGDLNIIPDSTPVPEPGTLIMLGSGLVGLILIRRRLLNRRSDS